MNTPLAMPETSDLADLLYGDRELAAILSPSGAVAAWLEVEAALAASQAKLGVIRHEAAAAIVQVCHNDKFIDYETLWQNARNVGYPILGLVRQIDAALPQRWQGSVHLGATTQDIMDTGLAMQLRQASQLLVNHLDVLCANLASVIKQHRDTIMAARTHGQQAVPTTLGAKLSVFLSEFLRHRDRLKRAQEQACRVSLHGAGGTAAAFGAHAAELRSLVAERLGLADSDVAWHVSRDSIVHLVQTAAAAAASTARLAREVIDLSRTEVAELSEASGHHRGASSTMPQKTNPITSEAVIGFAVGATSTAAGLYRAIEAGHERAAGEWQVEWILLPASLRHGGSALRLAGELVRDITVDAQRMRTNMDADGGLIMAEAAMMRLAPSMGRERAHDLVYDLAKTSRVTGTALGDLLEQQELDGGESGDGAVRASDYLGQAAQQCDAAIAQWKVASYSIAPKGA